MKHRSRTIALLFALVVLMAGVVVGGCGGEPRSAGGPPDSGAGPASASGAAGPSGATATGDLSAKLEGAGATFPQPLYLEWVGAFIQEAEGVRINYQGIGSGGGIQQLTQMTVDFGASDAPMTDEEISAAEAAGGAKVLHIPTVFGAVVLAYSLEGVDSLKLDQETLAGIFLGRITSWDDPALATLNHGTTLPAVDIQVVHRSDSSGTTSIFTTYLAQISQEWSTAVGKGKNVKWPVGIGGQGNDGVAAVIQQQPGTLGYVELSYALETGMPVATLKNKAGNFVAPSLESTSAAAEGVAFPEDLRFSVSDSAGENAYPIVGATWVLAYDRMQNPAKAAALKAFLHWCLANGSEIARELNYAPLPDDLRALAEAKIDLIQ